MTRKAIVLPTPLSYIDYINKIIVDSFVGNVPTQSLVKPTTSIAKLLVNESGFLIIEDEDR